MELETTLRGHTVHNAVREAGINPNYWYPVSWSEDLKLGAILPIRVWQQPIALYRDRSGAVYAIEDACPHKGVELHKGKVEGDRIACPYHGWEFDAEGSCAHIPYLPEGQKLPCAQARVYPAQERYGIVWVFPGAAGLAATRSLPEVPEYDDPNCFMIPIPGHFHAHFSICNENTMDVFHGYLHENLQGWYDPQLLKLKETDGSVKADYRVHYKGWITKVLGLSADGGVTTRTVSVHYQYPHYHSSLEGVSSLYLMRLPVGSEETRSFSMLFLRLPIPKWLIDPIRKPLMRLVRKYFFMPFLLQDVEMMESEQDNYRLNAQRRYVEINPAIIALQRVILRQYTQFMQQSATNESQQQDKHNPVKDGRIADGDIVRSPRLRQEPSISSPQ
ncbi:MAG: aromatic ring-hydroxylating dioxygenase subunit alpha [Cyanobacteria bacterium J06638_20]